MCKYVLLVSNNYRKTSFLVWKIIILYTLLFYINLNIGNKTYDQYSVVWIMCAILVPELQSSIIGFMRTNQGLLKIILKGSSWIVGKLTWGIGITRIELEAHRCQHFWVRCRCMKHFIGKVQKRFDFINRTDMSKTLLNVAKIQF